MTNVDLFLPLAKVDVDQRIVHGIATAESPDRAGEICDYETTKPYFETWSAEAQAASGGRSLGAVRAMHGRVAAGKLTDIAFDDEGKRILIAAKIVDDDEWEKVIEGVYTGFSQGGRYVNRWPDPETGLTRYTAEPTEISLVDLPCLPGATFDIVKDGVVEKRAFVLSPLAPPEVDAGPVTASVAKSEAAEAIAATRPALPSPQEALGKAAVELSLAASKLERAIEDNANLRKALAEWPSTIAALEKRIAAIEAQPAPARAALRPVPRSLDAGVDEARGGLDAAIKQLAELPERERALALMKVSLANPVEQRF